MEMQFDDLGLYDIYSAWHIPWWQTQVFYYSIIFIGIMICASIGFIIGRYWFYKKVTIPFWQQALNELDRLAKTPVVTSAQKKECYFVMTHVLKRYVGIKYNLQTANKTDKQFIECLQKSLVPIELLSDIENIFIGGLTIKFANDIVKNEQIQRDLTHAISFIKKTMASEVHDTIQ